MSKALLSLSAVLSFCILGIQAACLHPTFSSPGQQPEHYLGDWYTQGTYDEIFNPTREAACGTVRFSTVNNSKGSVDETRIRFKGKMITTCGLEPFADREGDLLKNQETGFVEAQLVPVGLPIENVTNALNCSMAAGRKDLYMIFYCCTEIPPGPSNITQVESFFYLTKSNVSEPILIGRMRRTSNRNGLRRVAQKMLYIPPGTCPNL